MYQWFTYRRLLNLNIIITSVAVTVVVCKKTDKDLLTFKVNFWCWTLQTISLLQIIGYYACKCPDARGVIVVEATLLSLAILAFLCGGKLINYSWSAILRSLGSFFIVLAFLYTVILQTSKYVGFKDGEYKDWLVKRIMFAMSFIIFDTQLVIDARYCDMTEDDFVFMSIKIFGDFVVIFSFIT